VPAKGMAKQKKKEVKKTEKSEDQEVNDSNELLRLIRLQIGREKIGQKATRAKKVKIPETE
jgi:hypothetical protein